MKQKKDILFHTLAVGIILLTVLLFFSAQVFDGKVLEQHDMTNSKAMQTEIEHYRKQTGDGILWTNSMFGGMPTYQIYTKKQQHPLSTFLPHIPLKIFRLNQGVSSNYNLLFSACIGIYLFLILFNFPWYYALIGALAGGFSAYNISLLDAGHLTKLGTLSFVAPVLAGFLLCYQRRKYIGALIFTLFFTLNIHASHPQITYYLGFVLLIIAFVYLVYSIKKKTLPSFILSSVLLLLGSILAVSANMTKLWPTYEYANETIRGGSPLSTYVLEQEDIDVLEKLLPNGSASLKSLVNKPIKTAQRFSSEVNTLLDASSAQMYEDTIRSLALDIKQSGLDKSYAFTWSYGLLEPISFLIPNFYGGSSNQLFLYDQKSKTFKAWQHIRRKNPALANQLVRFTRHYWGPQPSFNASYYMGSILIFLCFIGFFLVKGPLKWWVSITSVLFLFIAWGKHFSIFNFFLFDHFPLFNKFRDPKMIIGLLVPIISIFALYTLKILLQKERSANERLQAFYYGGITALILLFGSFLYSFISHFNTEIIPYQADSLAKAIQSDRAQLMRKDIFRSLIFICLCAGLIWLYLKGKIKNVYFVLIGIGLLSFIDIWGISKRYLPESRFTKAPKKKTHVKKRKVDALIQKDKTLHYRVIDFSKNNPFSDATLSTYHKSTGGYHAAKLSIYQDLIETYLYNPNKYMHILEMLNTKYIIFNDKKNKPSFSKTPNPLGNAWFVHQVKYVKNADEEINTLAQFNPQNEIIVQSKFKSQLNEYAGVDSLFKGTIRLTHYHPDTMQYSYQANADNVAVFSEVYYPPSKGWKVYLDGKPYKNFVKADYVLRALPLPKGKHSLTMIFEPDSFYISYIISSIAYGILSIMIIGIIIFRVVPAYKNRYTEQTQ